jgi:RNA polymerase sigma factor (sigma-70 family)
MIARQHAGRGIEFDDAFQLGVVGLISAVDNFDPSRGIAFSTFAYRRIKGPIQSSLHSTIRLLHVPGNRNANDDRVRLRKALWFDADDSAAELEESSLETEDFLAARLPLLSARERLVLDLRYREDKKLHEIGEAIGTTRERARQIIDTALESLRDDSPRLVR